MENENGKRNDKKKWKEKVRLKYSIKEEENYHCVYRLDIYIYIYICLCKCSHLSNLNSYRNILIKYFFLFDKYFCFGIDVNSNFHLSDNFMSFLCVLDSIGNSTIFLLGREPYANTISKNN